MAGGIEGAGLTGTEHQHRRTAAPSMADDYNNNFYSCRFCNGARHTAPEVDAEGRRLLDACAVAWADHFGLEGDELRPLEGDRDADYTHRTYDLDDPRKRQMRHNRVRLVTEALRALSGTWQRKRDLLALAARKDVDRAEIIETVQLLELQRRRALEDLQRFDPTPADAPRECRCKARRTLPAHLDRQCLKLTLTEPAKGPG
jgi:hypothetical protein